MQFGHGRVTSSGIDALATLGCRHLGNGAMKTTLVFLAFFLTILAVGYGLIDRADRHLPLADSDRQYASDLRPVIPMHYGQTPLSAAELHAIQSTPDMPRTDCQSVEVVPYEAAKRAHRHQINVFTNASGFGMIRMFYVANSRGIQTGAAEIDRAELISLLKEEQPAVYVLDQIATPVRMRAARRRSLDEFEVRGLQAVRAGAELVWSPEAPTRMFGAVRAQKSCIECHPGAREGDLLGAFTYFLTKPVGAINE